MIKKIRLEGINEREIESRYQLTISLLDNRHIEYRGEKLLRTIWLSLNPDKQEQIELFFAHGHITTYLWKGIDRFERMEHVSILHAFQYFNQRLEWSRKNWK
ncbi:MULTISPECIES: hypothetical protein [Lactococcus]|uniref:hypothetical protein n=1 Tax=Lactococcus TaxID=1357 RepID=UPI001F53D4F1|nr:MULTISPECIES: hypothetical protein [Lactococcus]MCI1070914.1 hypothetical protein [Lactococcus lactis]